MPTTLTYIIPSGAFAIAPSPVGALPAVPVGGALLDCNAVSYDYQYFLDLFDRFLDEGFLLPIKNASNGGYEVLQAAARMGERVSTAVKNLECGSYLIFAQGGQKATVTIEFFRETADAGAVTVLRGTVVSTSRHNRKFITLEDAVFGALDVGPIAVTAEAVAFGEQFNVEGRVITPSGITIEGEIDTIDAGQLSPAFGDPTLQVQNVLPATGGRCAYLDGLANNRGIERAVAETSENLRLRARSLPDTVSPDAILRALHRYFDPLGLTFDFIETFEITYQTVYDAPSSSVGTPTFTTSLPTNPLYDEDLFAYDDPRDPDPFRNRYLDIIEYRGAFIIILPRLTLQDLGLAYDSPIPPSSDSIIGTPAYDINGLEDFIDGVNTAAYDGFDIALSATFAALQAEINEIKPAGVAAIFDYIRP